MAGIKRCIGVDLGSYSVKIVEMAIDRSGVRVSRLVSAPIAVGPDAIEREREAAIVSTVRSLVKEHKIATKNAVFAMPGQTVFFKRQRLPRARNPHDQSRIIHFEARQLIPFPLEKTILQYQLFDTDNEHEVEVLLMAVKKETSQDFMRLIRRTGLRPIAICVSSLALFNGQEIRRFDFGHWQASTAATREFMGIRLPALLKKDGKAASKKARAKPRKSKKGKEEEAEGPAPDLAVEAAAALPKQEEEEVAEDLSLGLGDSFEEVRAYINIGARSTDLAVCKAGGARIVGFTRSIPIGGRDITNAVMKECRFESVNQAEEAKIQRGAVMSGTFEIEADRERYDERVCAVVTRVCDRIIAEIRRSLDYFISQADGTAVDSLVLSGGTARLAYLDSYVEERLGLPVEVSSSLNNEGLRPSAQYGEDFDFSPYKVALGLASQGLGISPVQIDFLPADVRSVRDFSTQYAEVVVLAGMIAGMVFFGSQVGGSATGSYKNKIGELEVIKQQDASLREAFGSATALRDSVTARAKILADSVGSRDFWLRFLLRIEEIKPPEILLTVVNCQPNYYTPTQTEVEIKGEAEADASVTKFFRALEADTRYVRYVNLASSTAGSGAFFGGNVTSFAIKLIVQDEGMNLVTRLMPILPQGATVPSGEDEGVRDDDEED